MGNKDNKTNKGFWIDPEIDKTIDEYLGKSKARSRSDFIELAVRNYAQSLDKEKPDADRIIASIKDFEQHMASVIFKLAGELATMELIIADTFYNNMDDKTLRRYRNSGYEVVRKRKAPFDFTEAFAKVKADREKPDDDDDDGYGWSHDDYD